jgi:hypothetical protein
MHYLPTDAEQQMRECLDSARRARALFVDIWEINSSFFAGGNSPESNSWSRSMTGRGEACLEPELELEAPPPSGLPPGCWLPSTLVLSTNPPFLDRGRVFPSATVRHGAGRARHPPRGRAKDARLSTPGRRSKPPCRPRPARLRPGRLAASRRPPPGPHAVESKARRRETIDIDMDYDDEVAL